MKDYQVGTHHLDGIVVFTSSHVRQNSNSFTANILDITPTLIYYLGLSIPKYMDGKVLREVFNDELLTTNELKYIDNPMKSRHDVDSAYPVEEENEIRRQLKDLGYLD
jgi:arylsulfatase A-like enzyme